MHLESEVKTDSTETAFILYILFFGEGNTLPYSLEVTALEFQAKEKITLLRENSSSLTSMMNNDNPSLMCIATLRSITTSN